MTRKAIALALAALLVASAIPMTGLVGTASASTYTHEFNNSEKYAVVDVGNYSGTYTLQVEANSDTPSGSTTTLYQEEYDASNTDNRWLYFGNYGAYGNITVKVVGSGSNSGSPEFMTGADAPVTYEHKVVASTGGDPGYSCGFQEQITELTTRTFQIDCNPLPGTTDVNTTDTDAQQTKLDIYQSGQNQEAATDNHLTTIENNLNDAKTVARIKGKNAYIRALNNGASESAAKSAAKSAVSDYYATQQKQYVNEWNAMASNVLYLKNAAKMETNVSATFVGQTSVDSSQSGVENVVIGNKSKVSSTAQPTGTKTLTLVNGNTTESQYLYFSSQTTANGYNRYASFTVDEANGTITTDGGEKAYLQQMHIEAPSSSYTREAVVDFQRFGNGWYTIEQQNSQVQADMDTLVNNTYSEYQSGDINNTDLIDPYVLASEHSPGSEYQGWAAAQLTLLGTNSPEAFDQIGEFNVTYADGTTESGVLFSQENPASGSFEVNTTYDPSQVGGTQYIVTPNRTHEITQNFTIDSITTHDGQTRKNVTIVEKTYTTTNTTELKQLYEELAFLRQQIETREQNLKTSGGGGAFFEGNSAKVIATLAVIAGLVLAAGRKEGGNNY